MISIRSRSPDAPKQLVPTGKKIYDEGVPDANVPPCASCHGPDAKGDGQFPRLAGQLNDYIFNKLTNWNKERGQDPKKPDASVIIAASRAQPEPNSRSKPSPPTSTIRSEPFFSLRSLDHDAPLGQNRLKQVVAASGMQAAVACRRALDGQDRAPGAERSTALQRHRRSQD